MKMKRKYAQALGASFLFAAITCTATAQRRPMPKQEQEHILIADEKDSSPVKETLSGINLQPGRNGNFQLDFSQQLTEDATLEISNTAGQVVYKQPVSTANNRSSWRYHVGRLRPGIYLIEVKTSDTTYWTKFRISKQGIFYHCQHLQAENTWLLNNYVNSAIQRTICSGLGAI